MPMFDTCERNRGRLNRPISCVNGENKIMAEFEAFHDATPRAPMSSRDLTVMSINMYDKLNKAAHHTAAYNLSNLIIRRGQEFTMGIVFNRPFNPKMDLFFIEFLIGNNPIHTQKTLISVSFGGKDQTNDWVVRVIETNNSETTLGITPATDCIVGLYSTYVTIITNAGKQRSPRNPNKDFYMLFNPWAEMDQVYLADEGKRQEYVLNDVGMIYNGDYANVGKRPWNYGQFQERILEACIFLLDSGKMPLQFRGDAAKVVRKASSMINSIDDNGVLEGSWGGDFSDGTAPTAWTGSTEILRNYYSTGGKPVKYAQCWVYAGVCNTFLRCLGLPARVITNFCSAHDSSGNLSTDIVLDEDGSLDREVSDTIWNFHCWNEVFLNRPDIPGNYSGWQVVDATPQEISDGPYKCVYLVLEQLKLCAQTTQVGTIKAGFLRGRTKSDEDKEFRKKNMLKVGYYRCGPAAVKAIKEANLGYSFDARFVFAEVNSDVVYSKRDKYGNIHVIYVDKNYVGKLIVTKQIGSNEYMNITDSYKYIKKVSRRQTLEQQDADAFRSARAIQPDADVQLYTRTTKNNKDVNLNMTFNNLSNKQRTITCKITGKVEYYTGATRTQFMFLTHEVTLKPSESKQEVITVTADEYKNFIIGQSFLCFIVYAFINETTMSLTAMESIHLGVPSLDLEVCGLSQVGKDMFAIVGFTNTLGYDLNNVTVRMEGINLFPVKTKNYSIIQEGSKIKWIESFKPQEAGSQVLVACLDCPTLKDVCGHLDIVIQPEAN